mmetsp:Transcript_79259/g.175824  ORF Transcript_79259/g.175824 Transcript_79259/m.175824 type:complete len:106 (-) Transcript_79259:1136-1453(-)
MPSHPSASSLETSTSAMPAELCRGSCGGQDCRDCQDCRDSCPDSGRHADCRSGHLLGCGCDRSGQGYVQGYVQGSCPREGYRCVQSGRGCGDCCHGDSEGLRAGR